MIRHFLLLLRYKRTERHVRVLSKQPRSIYIENLFINISSFFLSFFLPFFFLFSFFFSFFFLMRRNMEASSLSSDAASPLSLMYGTWLES